MPRALSSKPKPKLPEDEVEFFDCAEQKSEEWYELRRGMATTSVFDAVMAKGKEGPSLTRGKLMRVLAGERLTGRTAERFTNAYMNRGNEMEAAAREDYVFTHEAIVAPVGFVRRTIAKEFGPPLVVGCSPDGLVGADGVLEIKTLAPDLMIELRERGAFPSEHRWQCHGALWVTGRIWCDLKIYFEGMPFSLMFRIERSEPLIREIAEGVELFEHECRKLVQRCKS